MIYEDDYGHEINTETRYKCGMPGCGWIGTVEEMDRCADCGDEYDAIYSKYCCPNCDAFYLFITYWEKADEG